MRALVIVVACSAALALLGARGKADPGDGAPRISEETRAAGLRFAPEVEQSDRAWILAAIAAARPEAQRLIAEVDGAVQVRTDLPHGQAIGLAEPGG